MKKNNGYNHLRNPAFIPMIVISAILITLVLTLVSLFINFVREDVKKVSVPNLPDIAYYQPDSTTNSQPTTDATTSTDNTTDSADDTTDTTDTTDEDGVVEATASSESDVAVLDNMVLNPQPAPDDSWYEANSNYTVVPETDVVAMSFFDNTVFVGDSISKSFKLYSSLPINNVIADQNVSINDVINNNSVYYNVAGETNTLYQMIDNLSFEPEYIYVLLGSNSMSLDVVTHINQYAVMVDNLKAAYPKATIVLQTVTPITKVAEANFANKDYDITNEKIDDFNLALSLLAENKSVKLLDISSVLKLCSSTDTTDTNWYTVTDEVSWYTDGVLNPDYDGGDGVHINLNAVRTIVNYYRSHSII